MVNKFIDNLMKKILEYQKVDKKRKLKCEACQGAQVMLHKHQDLYEKEYVCKSILSM